MSESMFVTKKSLDRRTLLRGMGTAIALPFLDAMVPAFTPLARAAANPRLRFGVTYFPNGIIMQQFTPAATGGGFEFTPILKPLEPYKDSLLIVTNLTRSHPGSQVGDHAVSAAGFLTGVWPKRTEAEDVLANTTIDQVVAQQIGQQSPLPMETNPRAVFERLFGEPGTAVQQHARLERRRSILDSLAEDTKELERTLGPKDRA